LRAASEAFLAGERDAAALLSRARGHLDTRSCVKVDYLEIRDAESLQQIDGPVTRPAVLAVAAYVGATRLIDNQLLAP
jgi:pantoate--beta-alanine ligase